MIKLEALDKLYDRIEALDENQLWFDSVTVEVEDEIIRLNTQVQLGKHGIDADGISLGEYAPLTVEIRSSLGFQTSFVDFKITGWYWETFDTKVTMREIEVKSDDVRFNELVNELLFSPNHVGLTDENTEIIQKMILFFYNENIKERLFS